jgi:hypothetical protein
MPYMQEVYKASNGDQQIKYSFETTSANGLIVPRQLGTIAFRKAQEIERAALAASSLVQPTPEETLVYAIIEREDTPTLPPVPHTIETSPSLTTLPIDGARLLHKVAAHYYGSMSKFKFQHAPANSMSQKEQEAFKEMAFIFSKGPEYNPDTTGTGQYL